MCFRISEGGGGGGGRKLKWCKGEIKKEVEEEELKRRGGKQRWREVKDRVRGTKKE